MLSMDEFWTNAGGSPSLGRSSPMKNGRLSGSLFDTDLLNTSGRVSIDQVRSFPAHISLMFAHFSLHFVTFRSLFAHLSTDHALARASLESPGA